MKSKFPSFFFSPHTPPNCLACWFFDKQVYSLSPMGSGGITSFFFFKAHRLGEVCRQN